MIERRSYHDAVADPGYQADRRAQLDHEQQQRMAERQQQIALQSSPLSSAQDRIRLWEKLHALTLPRSPTHKLLRIIAAQTDLHLEQVLEIQRHRAAPAVPSVHGTLT
jgi:hypothetical protein